VGRVSLVVGMVGAALVCGFVALLLTIFLIVVFDEAHILMNSCSTTVATPAQGVSHSAPQTCTPASPWNWVVTLGVVLGAAAGAIGTYLFLGRNKNRSQDRIVPPVGQLSDCVSARRLDSWK
jgi:hypothetical protein